MRFGVWCSAAEKADYRHGGTGGQLLGARDGRPPKQRCRRRTTNKCNEPTPLHATPQSMPMQGIRFRAPSSKLLRHAKLRGVLDVGAQCKTIRLAVGEHT